MKHNKMECESKLRKKMMNNKNLCIYFLSSILTVKGFMACHVGQACSLDWVCVWQILSEGLLSPKANEELMLPCFQAKQCVLVHRVQCTQ